MEKGLLDESNENGLSVPFGRLKREVKDDVSVSAAGLVEDEGVVVEGAEEGVCVSVVGVEVRVAGESVVGVVEEEVEEVDGVVVDAASVSV